MKGHSWEMEECKLWCLDWLGVRPVLLGLWVGWRVTHSLSSRSSVAFGSYWMDKHNHVSALTMKDMFGQVKILDKTTM